MPPAAGDLAQMHPYALRTPDRAYATAVGDVLDQQLRQAGDHVGVRLGEGVAVVGDFVVGGLGHFRLRACDSVRGIL